MPVGADAYDLDLTGRVIGCLQREYANVPAFVLKAMQYTEDPKRLNGDLDVLKQTFERTADDAKNVAEHFDKLEEGLDVAETRAELRQAERDLGITRQMDQQYESSEQLAEQANKDAQELMSELEAGQPAGAPPNGEPGQNPPATGEPASGEPAAGQPASPGPAAPGQPAAPSFTPEQLAHGQQLARTLDELDRQAAAAAASAAQPGQPAPPGPLRLDTLAQAARSQQAAQAAARSQAQQEAMMALGEGGHESSDSSPEGPQNAEFGIITVNRDEAAKWGELRSKSAEDLTKGKSEAVSEEYRKSVGTYFRVLAERAKKK